MGLFVVENNIPRETRGVHKDDAVRDWNQRKGDKLNRYPHTPERHHGGDVLTGESVPGVAHSHALHQPHGEVKRGCVEQRGVDKVVHGGARDACL